MNLSLTNDVLDNIEHAMGGYLTYEDDELVFKGADFSLDSYLDFLAGVHGDKGVKIDEGDDFFWGGNESGHWEMWVRETPTFTEHDLIRALIEEVRELRKEVGYVEEDSVL